jgi:hypothetical protein
MFIKMKKIISRDCFQGNRYKGAADAADDLACDNLWLMESE